MGRITTVGDMVVEFRTRVGGPETLSGEVDTSLTQSYSCVSPGSILDSFETVLVLGNTLKCITCVYARPFSTKPA